MSLGASKATVPVAILSTPGFHARTVDPASVRFGDPHDAQQRDCTEAHGRGHVHDVDGDGDADLLLHFTVGATGWDTGDEQDVTNNDASATITVV